MASYVFESIDDAFSFGKYKELSLGDVIERNYEYIYWCVANVDIRFSEQCIAEMKDMYPDFIITKSFDSHILHVMYVDDDYDDSACCSNENWDDEWQEDWREEPTYDRYGGSYAQDVMGYSDDDIDTIFDGDPDAYWNID